MSEPTAPSAWSRDRPVAVLGAGRMGAAMARCLLRAGCTVRVYSRTVAHRNALLPAGATCFLTPADACLGVGAVISAVSDDAASRDVWCGTEGALTATLRPDVLAIECSTLSYGWVRELSGRAQARGLTYLDAPVTGLPPMAEAGTLTLLVGAEAADLERTRGLFGLLGERVLHFGPVGAGTAYKLIVNLLGGVQIASVAESLALAERAGLDLASVADALSTGQAASPQVVRTCARIVAANHRHDITFTPQLRLKDLNYALRLAHDLGLPVPFGEAAHATFAELCARGHSEDNESAVIDVARQPAPSVGDA